jgi:hypothetical protein
MLRSWPTVLPCLLLCAVFLRAQNSAVDAQAQTLHIPRVSRAPKLSDFLNGVPREAELAVTDFRQYTPGDGVPISQPTTAYLSYDDKNLYAAFVCKDNPELIRARVAKHDQILADDRVTVNLDTFHDHRHMYWFDVNPYGVQADGNVTDGLEDDPSWDTLWRSEGRITEDGFVVWMAIPFTSLRFPGATEQAWGIVLGRYIPRNNEFSVWPRVSSGKPGWVQQAGNLEGLRDISPGRNLQFIPYGLLSRSRYLENPAGGTASLVAENEARAGLDTKVVLKDAFALDLTFNPDFSQVESDEPQVTVNQRYEVYFPEKRPFFLENAGFFITPERLLFSRRIVDPRFGARLTGRLGKWSMGALFVDDRGPGKNLAPGDPLSGEHSPVGVFRVQREFGRGSRNSSIGAMLTSQDFGPSYNRVFSIDTRLQLLRNWTFVGQASATKTRTLSGDRLAGPAYRAMWYYQGRNLVSDTRFTDHSPNFRAQTGYIPRLDIREVSHSGGYLWRPEKGVLQSFGPVVGGALNYDRQGRLRDWNLSPEFRLVLTRGTSLTVKRDEVFELYNGRGYRQHRFDIASSSEWLSWLWVEASFQKGTAINYDPAPQLAPFLGRTSEASAGFTIRPEPHLQIEETYIYSGLRVGNESKLAGAAPGTAIFHNHIVRSKANYQFTRRLSLRFIADYNSILPNGALTSLEKAKRVGLDALFTYMLNPGTALHAGYTDLYENYRLDPALHRASGLDLNTGRQVFVKLSYLLRF